MIGGMVSQGLWNHPMYLETLGLVLGFLILVASLIFFLQKKSPKFKGAWASTKSWLFAVPFIFLATGLPYPWTLVVLLIISMLSAKTFFRMVGMYHRSWFVWLTYFFILGLGAIIHYGWHELYNTTPMIYLLVLTTIPFLRNSPTHMIQYIALSLLCFLFFGWAFLHMGRILALEKGIFILIYLYLLVEFCEGVSYAANRFFGRHKLFTRITKSVSIEGVLTASLLTVALAFGMRHLLPFRSEEYWVAGALTAIFFGRSGDLILQVIRRDLGVKQSGVFIIGRDDILARVDKLVFSAPVFYYLLILLEQYR